MLKSSWRLPATGALVFGALVNPAHALDLVVDFESRKPAVYGNGESFETAGFRVLVRNEASIGLTADCVITACPTGNATQVLSVLNDGGVTFARKDKSLFGLTGFDTGFIAPFGGLAGGFSPGSIFVVGFGPQKKMAVQSFAFTVDNGAFNFTTNTFTQPGFDALRKVTFFACTYNTTSDCVTPNENLGQFALDNLQVNNIAAIPEPGTFALMALGVAGLMLSRRRQAA